MVSYNPGTDTTTVEGHITYDAFGNVTNTPAVDILFGFTGRMFDEDTTLQNNLNRWYDAEVGRWLSEDPIGFEGEDANLYRYCGNSSTDQVDPIGLYMPYMGQMDPRGPLGKNASFLSDFISGNGQPERFYGPNTPETNDMRNSPGAAQLRNAFYAGGCAGVAPGDPGSNYGTGQAARDTVSPMNMSTRHSK